MRITDLNREGGIGSNSLLVEAGPFTFVVDAGLHPKLAGNQAMPDFAHIEDRHIDFVMVTHCHLDHIGSLPILLQQHPEARVLMSLPSQMLVERMLHNSCNVMKRQKAELRIAEYPLFTHEDVERIANRFEPLKYEQTLSFERAGQTLTLTLHQAGHVAGAGGFEVHHDGHSVFFTGDVLFDDQRTIGGARFPQPKRFDAMVIETTRGGTERAEGITRASEVHRLLGTIRATLERGGSILIPVFALGRMQELLTLINEARKDGRLPRCPVFGAGLGLDIADYFDQISKRTQLIRYSRKTAKELRLKRPPRQLKPGKEPPEQGIYILSSGMLVERTPSYQLAATLLAHGRNSICFVGYCDPDTPGGKLLETKPGQTFVFEAFDYQCQVRAQVERFEMSGHADREEILAFALAAEPKTIMLTHGDPDARDWFSAQLNDAEHSVRVIDPPPLQAVELFE
ncbi:MBL fold metallo-hydrolase [Pelagicoccus sp. SDUM812003]|uniref:MBL fold metallo-hydrolase n=1 Tax=Pelagicoccus sp. SDUM812003 TaxID=3041267 RepID=UPI00280D41D3|nr:MBL fold metallo-hydrolase [Pelagicoccus sp. SDUM812003]MDQ8203174.1 MBL fold metallo-hydrolase [Pelagicoccus sp. SDUM812003]